MCRIPFVTLWRTALSSHAGIIRPTAARIGVGLRGEELYVCFRNTLCQEPTKLLQSPTARERHDSTIRTTRAAQAHPATPAKTSTNVSIAILPEVTSIAGHSTAELAAPQRSLHHERIASGAVVVALDVAYHETQRFIETHGRSAASANLQPNDCRAAPTPSLHDIRHQRAPDSPPSLAPTRRLSNGPKAPSDDSAGQPPQRRTRSAFRPPARQPARSPFAGASSRRFAPSRKRAQERRALRVQQWRQAPRRAYGRTAPLRARYDMSDRVLTRTPSPFTQRTARSSRAPPEN